MLRFLHAHHSCLLSQGKTTLPLAGHVHDGPAFLPGLVERLVQPSDRRFAVVGPLSFGVGVMDEPHQARPVAGRRPLQHLAIPIRVAKGQDGAAADELVDADRFAFVVVYEIDLGDADQDRAILPHFELGFDAGADHLLGRDAVHVLDPGAHELDAASGDDVGPEIVGPQEIEKLQHGLVNHLGVETSGPGVAGAGNPVQDESAGTRRSYCRRGWRRGCRRWPSNPRPKLR